MSDNETPVTNNSGSAPEIAPVPEDLVDMNEETVEVSADSEEVEAENNHQEADELEVLRVEATKNLEGWQRTLAEFQNYKRRVEREQKDIRQKVALDILADLLPILDDFERAMNNLPDELHGNPWINGVRLMPAKFNKLLDNYEVTAIDPKGEEFDPTLHQAIGMDDSDEYESGHVIDTLQKGYICGDIVLRPALVRVAN